MRPLKKQGMGVLGLYCNCGFRSRVLMEIELNLAQFYGSRWMCRDGIQGGGKGARKRWHFP